MRSAALAPLVIALAASCSTPEKPGERAADPQENAALPPATPPLPAREELPSGAYLVVLGSGTPVPDPERSGPAAAVIAGSSAYLVDFGPGVVRRAAAAYRKGVEALEARRLSIAFATHLHSDHTAGLADLVFTPAVVGRHAPLRVFGPPGTRAMTENLLAAYEPDLDARRAAGDDMRGYEVEATEIPPPAGLVEVFRDGNVVVKAFAASHGTVPAAYGYRFEAGGRSFVVSGDTGPSQAVADACAGCDVLLHEVYCERGLRAGGPPSWQAYHRSHHTSALELGALAARAKPKRLAAYHVLDFGCADAQLLQEISTEFQGSATVVKDLDVL